MRIALIGTGNLAIHLVHAFETCNATQLVQWIGRKKTPPKQNLNTPYFTQYQQNIDVDLCLIAIADDAIPSIAEQLINSDVLVAHTAGAVSIDELKPLKRKGVFYPLQSFKETISVDWSTIPICIEATHTDDAELLEKLASQLSKNVHQISEHQRLQLHTAAVFANNFCNHLIGVSQNITSKAALPFSVLQPLIRETFERSFSNQAFALQTGPAKRNDTLTQQKHLSVLSEEDAELYRILSQSIFNTHNT